MFKKIKNLLIASVALLGLSVLSSSASAKVCVTEVKFGEKWQNYLVDVYRDVDIDGLTYSFKNTVALDNCDAAKSYLDNNKGQLYRISITDENVGMHAFKDCGNLVKVDFCRGTSTIDCGAFEGCKNLYWANFLRNDVKRIGLQAFSGTMLMNIDLSWQNELTELEPKVFSNCLALRNVELNDNLKVISYNAFEGSDDVIFVGDNASKMMTLLSVGELARGTNPFELAQYADSYSNSDADTVILFDDSDVDTVLPFDDDSDI